MGSRTTWNIQVKSGGSWGGVSTIYRPNDTLTTSKMSTQTRIKLADGDDAFIAPSTKHIDNPIGLIWYYDDGTIKTQVEGYIDNRNDLKITDHNSVVYYGRFISISVSEAVGYNPSRYDIQAEFVIMPGLE